MKFKILTLFPEMFPGPLGFSIIGKALKKKKFNLETINIRDFSKKKSKTVDDKPFGGGAGMIIQPDILQNSLEYAKKKVKHPKIIYLSPSGKRFSHKIAKEIINYKNVIIVCGRYEGIDERFLEYNKIEEISVGDYVLSGGETAALVVLDSVLRLLPGVLGNDKSSSEETFENGLLEYPQFTKPQIWEEKSVPEVLLSGDHSKIKDWRLSQSEAITRVRRPDLWQKYKKD